MSVKNNSYDNPGPLMQKTIQLVKQHGINETSFDTLVSSGWLQKLCAGTFRNPSVNRIEHIYNVLTNTKII